MPPEINLNPVLKHYNDFVNSCSDKDAVSRLNIVGKDGSYRVVKSANASCGGVNDARSQIANMRSRELFFMGVAKQFNGVDKVPDAVLKAMYEKDFTPGMGSRGEDALKAGFAKGTPLDARHIEKVLKAITKATNADRDLLADNLVKDAWKLLDVDAENMNKEALKSSLKRLFEGALPPKWETSKHFDRNALREKFGTEDIRELDSKIKDEINKILIPGNGPSLCRKKNNPNKCNETLKTEVYRLMLKLRAVFPSENYNNRANNKYAHVDHFRWVFSRKSGHFGDGSGGVDDKDDYAYDVKFKTDSERVLSQGYSFDQNRKYPQTANGANDFIKDLLYKLAKGEKGELCAGDQRMQFKNLGGWLKDKLGLDSVDGMSKCVTSQAIDESDKDVMRRTKDLFADLRGILDAKKRTGGETGLTEAEKWLDGVITKVESFASKKIGTLLWEHGLTTPFESADLKTFDSIAECVYGSGSREGKKGGDGFVGLFDDGKAFKCLTDWKQRFWIGSGLTDDEKTRISNATDKLRQKLVNLAGKVNAHAQSIVAEMLKPKSTNDVRLLSRSDVAKVVDFLAPYLVDKGGNKAKWLTLTSATTTRDNSFGSLNDVARELLARVAPVDEAETKEEVHEPIAEENVGDPKGEEQPASLEGTGPKVVANGDVQGTQQPVQNAESADAEGLSMKQLVEYLTDAERSELSTLPFPPDSPKMEKFADMVGSYADAILEHLKGITDKENLSLYSQRINKALGQKGVGGNVDVMSKPTIVRAVVKKMLSDKNVMATLVSPKKIDKEVFKSIVDQQTSFLAEMWAKIQKTSGAQEHGFGGDFLRCQTNDEFYKRFTFNGVAAPEGKQGDTVVKGDFPTVKVQNAGLQRGMKEMIPNPKIRSLVTMMCGLQGLVGAMSRLADRDRGTDYGYGPTANFMSDIAQFAGGVHRSNSLKFDLTRDASDLIFTMSVDATPEIKNMFMAKIKNKYLRAVSENQIELKMRIPLEQTLEEDEMPKFEVISVSQAIDGGSKQVYYFDTGAQNSTNPMPQESNEKVEVNPQVAPKPRSTVVPAEVPTDVKYKEFDRKRPSGMYSLGSRIQSAQNEVMRALEETIEKAELKLKKKNVPEKERPNYREELKKVFDDARALATGYKASYRKIGKGQYEPSAPSLSFIDVAYNKENVDDKNMSDSDRLNFYRLIDQLRNTIGPRIHNLIEEMVDEINDHVSMDDRKFIHEWNGVIEQLDKDLAGGIASGVKAKREANALFQASGRNIISREEKYWHEADKLKRLGTRMVTTTLPDMVKRYKKIVETAREFEKLDEKARNALKEDLAKYIKDHHTVAKDYGVLSSANNKSKLFGMKVKVKGKKGPEMVDMWEAVSALASELPDPRNKKHEKSRELHQHLPKSFFAIGYGDESYQSIVHRDEEGIKLKERVIEKAKFSGGKLVVDDTHKMQSPWQYYGRTTAEIKALGDDESPKMDAQKDTTAKTKDTVVKTVNAGIKIGKKKK